MPRQTGPDVEQAESHLYTTPNNSRRIPPQTSSAQTFDTEETSRFVPTPQKLSFEHNLKSTSKGGSGGTGLIWGISKPVLGVTILFLMAAAAGTLKDE
jgi:hypothetical protein